MAMSEQDRVRQSVAHKEAPAMVLSRYRALKGYPYARMADIPNGTMAVLLGEVLDFLSPKNLQHSIDACDRVEIHAGAIAQRPQRPVNQEARADSAPVGQWPHANFGTVAPGRCHLCKERITPADAFLLEITDALKVDVHGSCASRDPRCEVVTAFSFRLKTDAAAGDRR